MVFETTSICTNLFPAKFRQEFNTACKRRKSRYADSVYSYKFTNDTNCTQTENLTMTTLHPPGSLDKDNTSWE